MCKRFYLVILMVVCWLLAVALPAAAQDTPVRLSLSRTWGYSMGSDIQGSFNAAVTGPQNLASATFYLDGQEIGRADAAPFRIAFSTSQYPTGKHTLTATARTADGTTLTANPINVNMLSAAGAGQSILPIVGIVLALAALGMGSSAWIASRNSARSAVGERRNYGMAGGTICPKCERPFALPAMAPNMVTGKLTRCPYCGKWGIFRRANPALLAAAEARETADGQSAVPEMSEAEKLRRQVQESRYN